MKKGSGDERWRDDQSRVRNQQVHTLTPFCFNLDERFIILCYSHIHAESLPLNDIFMPFVGFERKIYTKIGSEWLHSCCINCEHENTQDHADLPKGLRVVGPCWVTRFATKWVVAVIYNFLYLGFCDFHQSVLARHLPGFFCQKLIFYFCQVNKELSNSFNLEDLDC